MMEIGMPDPAAQPRLLAFLVAPLTLLDLDKRQHQEDSDGDEDDNAYIHGDHLFVGRLPPRLYGGRTRQPKRSLPDRRGPKSMARIRPAGSR